MDESNLDKYFKKKYALYEFPILNIYIFLILYRKHKFFTKISDWMLN